MLLYLLKNLNSSFLVNNIFKINETFPFLKFFLNYLTYKIFLALLIKYFSCAIHFNFAFNRIFNFKLVLIFFIIFKMATKFFYLFS